ncbi:uncharacterized protein [Magallana gigas]|uniref:uncharacterized protein n=1 Tax=Magallana gigas TaxID=29159 RepID=UPI00334263CF
MNLAFTVILFVTSVLATYASRRPNFRPVGKQKPGRCPVSNIITTCDCRPENIKCRGDQDCPGVQKCCSFGCGCRTRCVNPAGRPRKVCRYNIKLYRVGQRFPATDGCNTCRCGAQGRVTCSKRKCATGNFCDREGPISFRPRYGKSIPNCLRAPGPVKRHKFINININKSVPYRCPGKGYVCGYSRVPRDRQGNVLVKCCTAQDVSYDESECVRYFRIESPKSLSPTKPGYFLVGSTPYCLSKNKIGFYNVECRFRKVKDQQKKYRR